LGHVLGAATYLVDHPLFGWISFGGNVNTGNGSVVTVQPKDAVRQRIFVAPVSLYVTIDSGTITDFTYNTASDEVIVSIVGSNANGTDSQRAVLVWEQTGSPNGTVMQLATPLSEGLGGYFVDLSAGQATTVVFTSSRSGDGNGTQGNGTSSSGQTPPPPYTGAADSKTAAPLLALAVASVLALLVQ